LGLAFSFVNAKATNNFRFTKKQKADKDKSLKISGLEGIQPRNHLL
jgi:hypothetical protein